ncbi:serine hydrolase domain-containing protein [Chryseobacterium chendengshani]|uniref:serine hydrolase domain-containing protein n=1 Tax=Chryseobacterium sp. LJ756 TaxID=2864113 RepID=UPI001C63B91E|nr:serine hydrolase domain-containing protein [Chryseobacterium sp. LJ756]MBW7674879.1 beta-lactamase family protein [Chryseobacterium sp. LJ756]
MIRKVFLLVAASISSFSFSQNNVREKLGNYLDSLHVHHKVMGSFAFASNNESTFVKVVGFSDAEKQEKANLNTQYRIGSISKTFTAVLIMKAIEDKKLTLNTKLSQFFPGIEKANMITIENLLQHRTGIHNLTDEEEYMQYHTQTKTEKDLIDIIKKYKSDFNPGIMFEYSNSNYIILGFILEKIYKKSYADLIKDKIARPLKLTLTEVGGKIDSGKNQAKSYKFINGQYQASSETDMSIPIGAGNIISTPTELLKFILSLENGKLITSASLKQMKNFSDDYGYGLVKIPFNGSSGFGHNGGIDEFKSFLYYFPDLKVAVSSVTNQSDYDNNQIAINMLKAAIGVDFQIPNLKSLPESELQQFVGNYSNPKIPVKFDIFIHDKTLMAQATGQSAFPLESVSKNSFKFDTAGIVINFDTSKKQFTIIQSDVETVFTKD